jgi:pentose-5-phosphate-3-epimerase
VIKAGANVLVAGSAIFSGSDVKSYQQNIDTLRCKI